MYALPDCAAWRHEQDPRYRLAGLIADAHLSSPLTMGQQYQIREELRTAAEEITEDTPWMRRALVGLVEAAERMLAGQGPIDPQLAPDGLPMVVDIVTEVAEACGWEVAA